MGASSTQIASSIDRAGIFALLLSLIDRASISDCTNSQGHPPSPPSPADACDAGLTACVTDGESGARSRASHPCCTWLQTRLTPDAPWFSRRSCLTASLRSSYADRWRGFLLRFRVRDVPDPLRCGTRRLLLRCWVASASHSALFMEYPGGTCVRLTNSCFPPAGMRSPLGEPIRSESVAGMDMLNDMFQRQVRHRQSCARAKIAGARCKARGCGRLCDEVISHLEDDASSSGCMGRQRRAWRHGAHRRPMHARAHGGTSFRRCIASPSFRCPPGRVRVISPPTLCVPFVLR